MRYYTSLIKIMKNQVKPPVVFVQQRQSIIKHLHYRNILHALYWTHSCENREIESGNKNALLHLNYVQEAKDMNIINIIIASTVTVKHLHWLHFVQMFNLMPLPWPSYEASSGLGPKHMICLIRKKGNYLCDPDKSL